MRVDEHLRLWNQAAVTVLDIRLHALHPREQNAACPSPASFFLFVTRGRACIVLDGAEHMASQFHILHGGKGAELEISHPVDVFEYYLISYTAAMPYPCRYELLQLTEQVRPFHPPFILTARSPLKLLEIVQTMARLAEHDGQLAHMQTKTLFYQLVSEIYSQLGDEHAQTGLSASIAQVVNYIETHYAEPLTVESLAERFDYSPGYLARSFKRHMGTSVIDYLIQVRIQQAIIWLLQTDASLQEIAVNVGYEDVYYFSRLFKKRTGLSPVRFRASKSQHSPSVGAESSIVPFPGRRYSDDGNIDNHYRDLFREGETFSSPLCAGKASFAFLATDGGAAGKPSTIFWV